MRWLLALTLLPALLQAEPASPQRWFKPAHAAAGKPLFDQHCAACHGQGAVGAPGWQQRGPDGRFPPPPLNGSGHAWHHPLAGLYQTIMSGSPGGQGNMPAFRDKLSRGEVLAIIAWFQSMWSDEIYAAWQRNNEDAKHKGSSNR